MTILEKRPTAGGESGEGPAQAADRPRRLGRFSRREVLETLGPLVAGFAVAWVPFHLTGLHAPFGLVVCWFLAFFSIYATVSYVRYGGLKTKDRLATAAVSFGTMVAVVPLVLIIGYVVGKGGQVVFTNFPHFLTADFSEAGPNDPFTKAGVHQAIIGTVEQVGLATLMTAPLAILTGVYLNEIPGRFSAPLRTMVDAMSGIPSIISGLFIYLVYVEPRGAHGFSGFAGSMAIAVVMVPTITRTSEEVLRIVPGSLREASLALGSPEWRMITRVVLPTARAGLVTAVILGVARDVGETAPVLFTAGGNDRVNNNPFSGPQADLPLQIYSLVRSPDLTYHLEAWGGALVLVVMVLTLFTLARLATSGGGGGRRLVGRVRRGRR